MTDPPLERAALTPREFIAGALAVIGCFVLAESAAQLAQFVVLLGGHDLSAGNIAELLLCFALVAALALFFILGRNRVAARLTANDQDGWHLDSRELQQAAIRVMGVCFMASGLKGLQFGGPEASARLDDHSIQLLPFLKIAPESLATFAIGTILMLAASAIHGWILRDHSRKQNRAEAR